MRIGEECPYITPCGLCSRTATPCKEKIKRDPLIMLREQDREKRKEREAE